MEGVKATTERGLKIVKKIQFDANKRICLSNYFIDIFFRFFSKQFNKSF
jgi:hypothetical protein